MSSNAENIWSGNYRHLPIIQEYTYALPGEVSTVTEEANAMMGIARNVPLLRREFLNRLRDSEIIYTIDNEASTGRMRKYAAIDGANDDCKENVLDIQFRFSSVAILNSKSWPEDSRPPSLLSFVSEQPHRVNRRSFFPRVPQLCREIQEYKAAIAAREFEPEILFMDGSVTSGSNWWGRRGELLPETDSCRYFDTLVRNDLIPAYNELLQISNDIPVTFFPKMSSGIGLIANYFPDLRQNVDFLQFTDLFLLRGMLAKGEYILPAISFNAMFTGPTGMTVDLGSLGIFSFREQLENYRTVYLQAGDPRLCYPARFELHRNWAEDQEYLDKILSIIVSYYDQPMNQIAPILTADVLSRDLLKHCAEQSRNEAVFRAAERLCRTTAELEVLCQLYDPKRLDRQ